MPEDQNLCDYCASDTSIMTVNGRRACPEHYDRAMGEALAPIKAGLAGLSSRPELRCAGCGKTPEQVDEYVISAQEEGMTPTDFCWSEEGTLDRETGRFLCTTDYIACGMPSSPTGWRATPENLRAIGVRV